MAICVQHSIFTRFSLSKIICSECFCLFLLLFFIIVIFNAFCLKQKFVETEEDPDTREMFCYQRTRDYLPTITGLIYVLKEFNGQKELASILMTQINAATHLMIKNSQWLDNSTKPFAIEKVNYYFKLVFNACIIFYS